jgi:hypothetical protein
VWLEAWNLKTQYQSSKLAPKRHGPFQVIKEVSPVAYQLRLPASWRIHDVFHVSLLSPYREMTAHGPNFTRPPPDLISGEEEYEVEAILNHRRHGRSRTLQYLIKWKGYPNSNNTWEPADQVHAPELTKSYHRQHPEVQDKRARVHATISAPPKPTPNWLRYLPPSSIRALYARAITRSSPPAPLPTAPRPAPTPWNTLTSVANHTAPSIASPTTPCPTTMKPVTPTSSPTRTLSAGSTSMHRRPITTPHPLTHTLEPSPSMTPCQTTTPHSSLRIHHPSSPSAPNATTTIAGTPYASPPSKRTWPSLYMMQEHQSTRRVMSPDLAAKHTSTNISPGGLQLESTGTMPIANVPTVEGYTTRLLNAQSLSHKCSTMHRASRRILSQYLQSLRKARPLLAATQSAQSNPYRGGQGSLGLN